MSIKRLQSAEMENFLRTKAAKRLPLGDRRELRLFSKYVQRRVNNPKETEEESYAAIYGEQIFPAAKGTPRR